MEAAKSKWGLPSWVDPFLMGANIVMIILLIVATLNSEAPLKKALVRSGLAKTIHVYLSGTIIFSIQMLGLNSFNYAYQSLFGDPFVLSNIIWRMSWIVSFIILSLPTRYIFTLMAADEDPSRMRERQANTKARVLQDRLFGPAAAFSTRAIESGIGAGSSSATAAGELQFDKSFTQFERKVTATTLRMWQPLPQELLEMTRLYQLFAKVKVHGIQNVPNDSPALIITNHALGHGFDVPMMIYILRRYCRFSPRVLVEPYHFNIPLWGDLIYKLGGAPRTRHCMEILMKEGQTILVFASHREEGTMVWDAKRKLQLDLANEYNYAVVPAVCVSNEDVLEIVYNLPDQSYKHFKSLRTLSRPFFKRFERKQYHLHFGQSISVADEMREESDSDDDDFDSSSDYGEETKISLQRLVSDDFAQRSGAAPDKVGSPDPLPPMDPHYSGQRESKDEFDNLSLQSTRSGRQKTPRFGPAGSARSTRSTRSRGHRRGWSRELEIRLKSAVEDSIADGIVDMYKHIRSTPDESVMDSLQSKLKTLTGDREDLQQTMQQMVQRREDGSVQVDSDVSDTEADPTGHARWKE